MKDLKEKARAYALKNALTHQGKAQQGAVISGLFAEGLKPADMKKYGKDISKIVKEINSLSLEKQEEEFKKHEGEISKREVREGLPELPEVNKKTGVITRFAPAPSGQLHIGHFISNVLPFLFVKKYGGKFYVRIEDTNPEKIDPKAYEGIKDDCEWVYKGEVKEYIIQSDRIEIYYKYAKKLIESNHAYICTCKPEKFREYVNLKENCPCRNNDKKENLMRWEMMLGNTKEIYGAGEAVLRFKTPKKFSGMENPNPAMRDFPLARINLTKHPRQGKKYRVWPLMHLAVPVDDMEYKMTHIIRGKDHRDNAERQKMIFEIFEKKYPWTFFMGRIKFKDLNLGKRFIKAAIEAGEYSGWDDERLPTIKSLRKRGYKPESFWKLAEHRGLTEVDKVMASKDLLELLDKFNKE